jgi:hypothetical protein
MVGFICMFTLWIDAMRGKEFDPDFFGEEGIISVSLMLFLFGYISLLIVCIYYMKDKKYFTKFIYKIANIGVKKEESAKEE